MQDNKIAGVFIKIHSKHCITKAAITFDFFWTKPVNGNITDMIDDNALSFSRQTCFFF